MQFALTLTCEDGSRVRLTGTWADNPWGVPAFIPETITAIDRDGLDHYLADSLKDFERQPLTTDDLADALKSARDCDDEDARRAAFILTGRSQRIA